MSIRSLAFIPIFAACASAQIATTTSLVGTVTDPGGAAIPNATITAVETNTGDKYTGTTTNHGYYSLEFVRVGTYSITAEAAGFQKLTKTGILVSINQTVRTDIELTVGQLTQSIVVEAQSTVIATDDAAVREIMGTQSISDLPLNGRDPMQLARMTAGVLPGVKSSATGIPPGEDFNGAGTREIQNSLSLDGISIMNNLITTTPTRPMTDAISEVEIQTGTYSAQYGSYMGVHVNMVTKSGTNQVHGALLEFLRNQVLDARNFFTLPTPANPTAAKPPLRQNQFGFELDGPVVIPKYNGRNKTFFMSSYEGYRLVQQATQLSTEMPAAFFTGNFSNVPASAITGGIIKDPLNGNAPFPGNIIPSSRVSPIVAKLQQYYPASNLPGLASNYSVPVPTTIGNDQTVDRIDQNIGDRVRLYVRAHYQNENVFAGNAIPANASTVPVTTSNYTFGYTHTLTPNLVNDFRVGRNRLDTDNLNYFTVKGLKTAGSDLGITGFGGDVQFNNPGIPEFNVTGFNGLGNSGSDWYQADSTYQLSEQLSWSHGAHQIMAGMEIRRLATAREATNSPRGQFTFNGTLSGYAPADFILGLPQSFSTPGPEVHGHVAEWRDGFFILDKWQISRKLT
ncbi:MAG TPA: carboxypeptidase-like regulatory domain-containing protein, partial [Bryobacteraceae bacterium]